MALRHTQLLRTPSFSHNFVTLHLSHTALSHTIFVAHHHSQTTLYYFVTHHLLSYIFVTHHLSPTPVSHSNFVTHHLCHAPPFTHHLCHTPSFTHIFHTPSLSHTIYRTHLSHTIFVTNQLCCKPSFTHHLCHTASFTHTQLCHTQLCHTHTQIFTYKCLSDGSSTTSFIYPSFPIPLDPLVLLMGLSGPLIVQPWRSWGEVVHPKPPAENCLMTKATEAIQISLGLCSKVCPIVYQAGLSRSTKG